MAKTKSSEKAAAPRNAPAVGGRDAPTRGPTKQAVVIGLLQREGGATLADLMAATGWLAHTTRAALTRLRQAGHVLDKATGETGATAYRIAALARAARSRKAA